MVDANHDSDDLREQIQLVNIDQMYHVEDHKGKLITFIFLCFSTSQSLIPNP
jgi:hypothetical protein